MMFLSAFVSLFVMASIIFATQVSAHEEWHDTAFTDFSEGLKQFPLVLRLRGAEHLVTLQNWKPQECPQEEQYRICVRFNLVTHEGKDTEIDVILPESEAQRVLFMHEMAPNIGKYVSWNTVILFSPHDEIFGQTYYHINEMMLMGRFYFRGKDSIKDKYHFERYIDGNLP
ncbi:MAG: hypothetical protein Q8R36_02535 [bacterium]|nr:hypothetical protein [bacterium]